MPFIVVWFVLLCLDVFWLVRTWRSIRMRPSPADVKLTAYQAAYLLGGRNRVVETAIAKLLDDGRLRATRETGLVRAEGVTAQDPVDVAVLSGLRTPAPLRDVVRTSYESSGVVAVSEEMSELGLTVTERDRARLKLFYAHAVVLFVLGFVSQVGSGSLPVGILVMIVFMVQFYAIRGGLGRTTAAGDKVAWRVRSGTARAGDLRNPMIAPVVLQGFKAYPDAEVRQAAYGGQRARHGDSCSSSCGGGSCSSCSSSSCGSASDSGSSSCSSSSCGGGSSCSSSSS